MINPCSHRPLTQDIDRFLGLQAVGTDEPDTVRDIGPPKLEQHLLILHIEARATKPMKRIKIVAEDAYLALTTILNTKSTTHEIRQIVEATADMNSRPVEPVRLALSCQVSICNVRVTVQNCAESRVARGEILVVDPVEAFAVHELVRDGRATRVPSD